MTTQEFTGRVAIVTGASSGIGRATAQMLAQRGASVVVFARSEDKLKELANGKVLAVPGDVEDPDAIERLFSETKDAFGDCDLLVNNAGVVIPHRIAKITAAEWDHVFAVNMRAAFLACQHALPGMLAKKSGTIINVSSISGVLGPEKFAGFTSYNASKAALIAFTEALAVEVKDTGVRVNCVSPGSVDTKMWAGVSNNAPAAMTPEEVAEVILFLASDRSRPVNGQNLHVWSV